MDNQTQWWSSLDSKWQAVLKEAIGINREPTDAELKKLFELKKIEFPIQIPMGLDVRSILLKMPNLQFIRLSGGNFDLYLTPSPSPHSKQAKSATEITEIEKWNFENELRAFRKYRRKTKKTK